LGVRIPPTGKQLTVKSIQFRRIVDGKVAWQEGVFDGLDLLEQMDLIVSAE
jgi:predicted ester cyclase